MQATIYLIPIPIAEEALHTLSPQIAATIPGIKHFFVEDLRTARRFLKSVDKSIVIDDLQFSEIDKHSGADTKTLKNWINQGHTIGIMSEAGCPGIADPGAELVALAHQLHAKVIPLTGPNSLILALMASGLNGQSFCFSGYLPVKDPARSQRIKQLENDSRKENQTQLFIETPYRNNNMLEDLLKNCVDSTRICIAQNITGSNESIKTRTVAQWKNNKPQLEKAPAVFLLLAQ
ncbi:MAG: SAM-dependent methyltransferase [Sphingobacteriales bacterium]|nr:MAG: SAM-dependent methyltransferase [Sphingobacteriales bacterium]